MATDPDKQQAKAETLAIRFGLNVLAHSVGRMAPSQARAEIEKFRRRLKTSLAQHKWLCDH
jgi:hypothetical protein